MAPPLDPALARLRSLLTIATAAGLFLTIASLAVVMLSFMLFDAPGSERNRYLLVIAWSIWLFPVACVAAVGSAWVGYALRWLDFARFVLFLPVANCVALGVGVALLQKYCGGRFVC